MKGSKVVIVDDDTGGGGELLTAINRPAGLDGAPRGPHGAIVARAGDASDCAARDVEPRTATRAAAAASHAAPRGFDRAIVAPAGDAPDCTDRDVEPRTATRAAAAAGYDAAPRGLARSGKAAA